MSKKTIRNYLVETRRFSRRILVASALMLILIAALVARLVYLQIYEHQTYTTLSEENQLNLIPIDPARGFIYDRNGVLLAENIPMYSLDLIPDRVKDFKKTLADLRKIIDISDDDVEHYKRALSQHRPFDLVSLKLKLTDEEVAKFYLDQYRFPGVTVTARMYRFYPLGDTMVTALGYVGRINEEEARKVDSTNYSASNYIGKTGVEKYYESMLHGIVGYQQVETDASGRAVRVMKKIPPISGDHVYLSLDTKLQITAEDALGEDQGAVVAIQPQTGQILALVSNPRYDPNLFVRGIGARQYRELQMAPDRPLFNRAIRATYPPGSTVKPLMAIQGLDTNAIDLKTRINDPGYLTLPGNSHVYRDWVYKPSHPFGHGIVDVHKAIVQSCDVFFYNVGLRLGIKRVDDIYRQFGYGQKTGADLEEELPGVLPSPEWKRGAKGDGWYTGDTVNISIGQGFMLVTPLQLAKAAATIANRGVAYKPRLLMKRVQADGTVIEQKPIVDNKILLQDPSIWDTVIDGMKGVVTEDHGTAYKFGRNPPYTIAAKTGTAQIPRPKKYEYMENDQIPKQYLSNSLFIAFAPVENPQIAVGIIVQHHPGQAVVVAKQVIDYYLLQELAKQNNKQQGTQGQLNPAAGEIQQGPQGEQHAASDSNKAGAEPILPIPNLLKSNEAN